MLPVFRGGRGLKIDFKMFHLYKSQIHILKCTSVFLCSTSEYEITLVLQLNIIINSALFVPVLLAKCTRIISYLNQGSS